MDDELPEWAEATIARMNQNPDRTQALLSLAGWPQIGERFEVFHAGLCPVCGHPQIDVVEEGDGEVPVSLVTSGCLVCDVFKAVDLEDVDLIDWDRLPEGTDPDASDDDARGS